MKWNEQAAPNNHQASADLLAAKVMRQNFNTKNFQTAVSGIK
ncbi:MULTISPECIES: hypothetical protein [Heyndrickxia]|nr:hypothetical protein [Heyndrickxia coagulans]UXC23423.1 hypothetical protein N4P52_05230 [Heyndrickxia coagulans]